MNREKIARELLKLAKTLVAEPRERKELTASKGEMEVFKLMGAVDGSMTLALLALMKHQMQVSRGSGDKENQKIADVLRKAWKTVQKYDGALRAIEEGAKEF